VTGHAEFELAFSELLILSKSHHEDLNLLDLLSLYPTGKIQERFLAGSMNIF
jgi:hypothetical protein